ncbi:MAG: beta-lactamase family protein, partial [Flavobacteriales bacterium]|nr:beta-lactamase family protein [Flavobacteriales bacterium]
MIKNTISIALCFIAFSAWTQTSPSKSTLKKIDRFLSEEQVKWNIPGMAVTIVSADEVLLSKGYGVKSVDTMEPVDDKSLFAVASNTKAFTAAAIGMLVDEGKLSWDDKVRDYLPYF